MNIAINKENSNRCVFVTTGNKYSFLFVFASKTWCTTQPVNIILINSTKHLNKRLVAPQLARSENAMYINWDWNDPKLQNLIELNCRTKIKL